MLLYCWIPFVCGNVVFHISSFLLEWVELSLFLLLVKLLLTTFFRERLHIVGFICLQQSAAFKILRTRLKTVPFSENLKRTSSANPYSQILQVTEDGNRNQDTQNYSAINFPFLLQQFENMQLQHRNHLKDQLQSRKSASALTLSQVFFFCCFCSHVWLCYIPDLSCRCCHIRNSCWKLSVVCSCSTYVLKYLVF